MRPGVIDDAECLRARALPKGRKGRRTKRNALVTRSFLVKKKKKSAGGERVSSGKHVQQNEERKTGKETRTLPVVPKLRERWYGYQVPTRSLTLDVAATSTYTRAQIRKKMATIRLGQEGLRERESDNAKVIECALIEN